MSAILRKTAAVVGLLAASACGTAQLVLPADSAGTELFQQAQDLMEQEKWSGAVVGFDTLLRNYPTSPHLPQARLALGRAYYEQDRTSSLILAIDAFRNFLTYHPSHDQVDYAQLMIAMSYMSMMRSPDRDQSQAMEALRAFEIFFEDYPESANGDDARTQMQAVIDNLSEHELKVAEFQLSKGLLAAARERARYAMRKYAATSHRCDFVWILAESHRRQGDDRQATIYFQRILDDYPDCERASEAQRRLGQGVASRPS